MALDLNPAFHAPQTACRSQYWPTPDFVSEVVNYKRGRSHPEAALSAAPVICMQQIQPYTRTQQGCAAAGVSATVWCCVRQCCTLSSQPNCFKFIRSLCHKAASHCSPSWGTMFNWLTLWLQCSAGPRTTSVKLIFLSFVSFFFDSFMTRWHESNQLLQSRITAAVCTFFTCCVARLEHNRRYFTP